MLVNFALNSLNTEVTCDKVSRDGYEPENLLLPNTGWVQKGFLAECFIKPPITLSFKFPCPVHLKAVILDPRVGSQISSHIELYTATRKRQRPAETSVRHNYRQSDNSVESKSTHNSVSQLESEPIFKKIGSIHSSSPGKICFRNPRFSDSTCSNVDNVMESCPLQSELRHSQPAMLSAADFLAVRIVATASSSVPAVGKIYIWGQPGHSCSPALRESIFEKFSTVTGSKAQQHRNLSHTTGLHNTAKKDSTAFSLQDSRLGNKGTTEQYKSTPQDKHLFAGLDSSVSVPEEFLDALTFEVMSLPMLLPSGQTVDVSTLDRCSDAEANYGRPPSDPFTGLTFTASRKPVVNMPLKLRIDRFLLDNADEPSLKSVPRAVGSAIQCQTLSRNKEKTSPSKLSSCRNRFLTGGQKRKLDSDLQQVCSQAGTHCRQSSYFPSESTSASGSFASISKWTKTDKNSTGDKNAISSSQSEPSFSTCASSSSSEAHEERLRSSLSSSLSSVLRKLPTFSNPSGASSLPSDHPVETDQLCVTCKTVLNPGNSGAYSLSSHGVAYVLPCQHKMCRFCLLKESAGTSTSNVTCGACGKQFAGADVERSHVWS